mmetsp:Transcript_31130/g.56637  ORF Transcript_31130/g.56637 Transcript_31130/m.56637 type:complete len:143 (+) Transcript_31130:670-1098(+)
MPRSCTLSGGNSSTVAAVFSSSGSEQHVACADNDGIEVTRPAPVAVGPPSGRSSPIACTPCTAVSASGAAGTSLRDSVSDASADRQADEELGVGPDSGTDANADEDFADLGLKDHSPVAAAGGACGKTTCREPSAGRFGELS